MALPGYLAVNIEMSVKCLVFFGLEFSAEALRMCLIDIEIRLPLSFFFKKYIIT